MVHAYTFFDRCRVKIFMESMYVLVPANEAAMNVVVV